VAAEKFKEAGVQLVTLTDYNTLIQLALESNYIQKDQVELLSQWRRDPAGWNVK